MKSSSPDRDDTKYVLGVLAAHWLIPNGGRAGEFRNATLEEWHDRKSHIDNGEHIREIYHLNCIEHSLPRSWWSVH